MTDVDLTAPRTVDLAGLRKPFPTEAIGLLPKIWCSKCSRSDQGSCGEHKKEICRGCRKEHNGEKCKGCGNNITTAHLHVEFVGHADVTDLILDVDPEWGWEPMATDPDPEVLKAAIASGNPEIVAMVYKNAPPRLERNDRGTPVGLWMRLKVGTTNRIGFGSVPATQRDAEKVLIGDAVRNAGMRGGAALELWKQGDRADPTAENSTGSGTSRQHAHAPAQPRGQVTRPQAGGTDRAVPPLIPVEWQKKIDGITTREEADAVRTELMDAVRGLKKTVSPALGNRILAAIKAKALTLPEAEAVA